MVFMEPEKTAGIMMRNVFDIFRLNIFPMKNLLKTDISACYNNIIAILKMKYASTYQEEAQYILVTLRRGYPIDIKS